MPDLSNCIDLPIIGIGIVGPGINDLDTFGFQVFHGLKNNNRPVQQYVPDDDLKLVITKTIHQARLNLGSVGVVTFQSGLKERIDNSKIGITTKEITAQKINIVSAWLAAADWLDSQEI